MSHCSTRDQPYRKWVRGRPLEPGSGSQAHNLTEEFPLTEHRICGVSSLQPQPGAGAWKSNLEMWDFLQTMEWCLFIWGCACNPSLCDRALTQSLPLSVFPSVPSKRRVTGCALQCLAGLRGQTPEVLTWKSLWSKSCAGPTNLKWSPQLNVKH